MNKIEVSVCMGSSCYPRGNHKILAFLKEYVQQNNLEDKIDLKGNLCEGFCKDGPVVKIDGKVYCKLTLLSAKEHLEYVLKQKGVI